jgi:hypothetical protein
MADRVRLGALAVALASAAWIIHDVYARGCCQRWGRRRPA